MPGFDDEQSTSLRSLFNETNENLQEIRDHLRELATLIRAEHTDHQDTSTQTEEPLPTSTPEVNPNSNPRHRQPETHHKVRVEHHQIDDINDLTLSSTPIYASSVRLYFNRNNQLHRVDVRERITTTPQTSTRR